MCHPGPYGDQDDTIVYLNVSYHAFLLVAINLKLEAGEGLEPSRQSL